jgi:replicative DNA helicase
MTDRTLPHATSLEEAVLGAIMMESALGHVSEFLKPEMFYDQKHRYVYEAACDLDKVNSPIDMLTITNRLKELGRLDMVGGPYWITQLTSRIGSATNIEYHARIIAEKWTKREVIRICEETLNKCYDDTEDIFETVEACVSQIEQSATFKTNDFSPKARMEETRKAVYAAYESPTGLSGVSTGFNSLDRFTGGLIPGDLTVVGGMPGTFKTGLSLALLHNADRSGIPVLMFEQEMSGRQVGMREVAMVTQISTERLKTGKISDIELQQVEMAIGQIEKKQVFIDLASGVTTGRIKAITKRMKKEHGIGLVVIDYLGLMNIETKKHGTTESAIDSTVKELKILAKTLDIPVILLAQFSRESSKNLLTPPIMSYLKGSGGIEAHADNCWLLWNPAKYDQNFVFDYGNGEQIHASGKLAIVHDKNRQGRTGIQWIEVDPGTNTFKDLPEH